MNCEEWCRLKRIGNAQRFLFTLPVIAFALVFLVYPIAYSFIVSFTNFDGINAPSYIGFGNYTDLFTSPEFKRVAFNNLYVGVLGIPLSIIVPLVIAVLLYEEVKGYKFFKVSFLLPSALSVVIIGIVFRTFFQYNGPVNKILEFLGLSGLEVDWLSSGYTSVPVIVLAMIWATFGVNIIIYLAGMSMIPQTVYESTELDGFSWFQKLRYITIPMMIGVIEFVTVNCIVNVFSSMFGYIYTITNGGPGYESTVLEYLIFIKGFMLNNLGLACAISVILFILMILLARVVMKVFKEDWL